MLACGYESKQVVYQLEMCGFKLLNLLGKTVVGSVINWVT